MDADCSAYLQVEQVFGRTSNAVCWVAGFVLWSGDEVGFPYFLHKWEFAPFEFAANMVYIHCVCCAVREDGKIKQLQSKPSGGKRVKCPVPHLRKGEFKAPLVVQW